MVGKTLRNYRITEKLGVGGQGTVYKATDLKLGRTVVIKVIPPELSAKEANLKRFEREARLASSLDHPNICTIFDLDEVDGIHFIAMQHVDGKNVRQLVAGRPLELKTALLIGLQVADALARMRQALDSFIIEGVTTTIPFLGRVMRHPDFVAGTVDTKFLERETQLLTDAP